MKLEKKKILSVLTILCFGIAVSLVNFHGGNVGILGNATDSVQITADLSVNDVKFADKSGEVRIDFDVLKEQNPDIYAWITIPGTRIDYPVLQKRDSREPYDDFYLTHTVDLTEGFPGAIYSQAINQTDFMDFVTILYGHNLKDGGMFSSLHEFEDKDFFEKNRQIIIYMPDATVIYEIFAAVDFSDVFIPYEYDIDSSSEVHRYLDDVKECEGNFRENMKISENDKILTLSTCYSERDDRRLLIEAVMVEYIQTK